MIDLKTLTITEARKRLDNKEFSAVDLASWYLDEIQAKNKEINAYLEIFDDVLVQAQTADEMIKEGKSFPLLGIPLAIKDVILIEGRRVGAASKILENYIATYDATVIKKLKDQGAVFLGRANTDEFAMGSTNENSVYGRVKNALDETKVSGGSSGGSAVAVKAGLCMLSLVSDI